MNPITSVLLEKEPDFFDLVKSFVTQLPPTVEIIKRTFQQQQWQQLKKEVHELKGMGGGFGYPMLTELAAIIEFEISSQITSDIALKDANKVKSLLEQLEVLTTRIVMGLPGGEQQCA